MHLAVHQYRDDSTRRNGPEKKKHVFIHFEIFQLRSKSCQYTTLNVFSAVATYTKILKGVLTKIMRVSTFTKSFSLQFLIDLRNCLWGMFSSLNPI